MPPDLAPALALMGVLVLCIALGAVAGWWAHRVLARHNEVGRLGDTIAFVGGAFGIMLGLILVFAAQHFTEAEAAARDEAVAAVALYNALEPFPVEERDRARHTLVCVMRSTMGDDWTATAQRDMTGSGETNAWTRALLQDIQALPQETDAQAQAYYFVSQEMVERSKARQQRLLRAQPEIPVLVWVVIFVSTFVFVTLLVFHLADRPWLAGLALICTAIILLALVGTLALLDYPFGWGPAVEPDAMAASLERLQDAYGGDTFAPCGPPPAVG